MNDKRKPDWNICINTAGKWITVGAAWTTPKGYLSITMNDGFILSGRAMMFPYKERTSWGSREQGAYPKGYPGNIRPGESMQEYHNRAQRQPDDYMERKRAERQQAAASPQSSSQPEQAASEARGKSASPPEDDDLPRL